MRSGRQAEGRAQSFVYPTKKCAFENDHSKARTGGRVTAKKRGKHVQARRIKDLKADQGSKNRKETPYQRPAMKMNL